MIKRSHHLSILSLLLLSIPGPGGHPFASTTRRVAAIQAQEEVPEQNLLDVGIEVFDPGLPEDDQSLQEDKAIFPELRKSEARFIPFHLKNTLESTGQWGAVRVLPQGTGTTDVLLSGRIRKSTGRKLVIQIRVVDSSGRVWEQGKYDALANARVYKENSIETSDPYQDLYNKIANDMLAARERISREEIHKIREVSRLRFAADLAPTVYSDYFTTTRKGKVEVVRLPSENDPMMKRIDRIRQRDDLFVDTLNEYYAGFYARMSSSYTEWRKYSYKEQMALLKQQRKANKRKWLGGLLVLGGMLAHGNSQAEQTAKEAAVIGGIMTISSGIEKSKEAQINVEALKELAASFDAEVSPMLVDVEGQTRKLQGSAETQYSRWRHLLVKIFSAETGLPSNPDDSVQAPPAAAAAEEGLN